VDALGDADEALAPRRAPTLPHGAPGMKAHNSLLTSVPAS
jgi:hypothetical protein